MTEERIVAYLWALINTGAILNNPDVFTVDARLEDGLMVECGERRFAIDVRDIGPALEGHPRVLDAEASRAEIEAQRTELERMIEEGYDDLEKNGCVPPEEVERSCREAIARGLARRQAKLDREAKRQAGSRR